MDGHLLFQGWSPTNPRMVTHQKELLYTLEKRHLDITHQTKARMVTYHLKDGHPPEGSVVQTWNLALKLNQTHKTKDR